MSRAPNRDLPPLELDGIRYEQIVMEQSYPMERRSGFMRAVEMATGKILWEIQVYKVSRNVPLTENGEEMIDPHMLDCFFLRFKFMPDKKYILVENEVKDRFLINIETQEVREACDADFPQEKIFKVEAPNELLPLVHRGNMYMQHMAGFYYGDGRNTGMLKCHEIGNNRFLWQKKIYEIPFDDDLEGFTSECYFIRMNFAQPGRRDIFIMNQRMESYYFNIRSREVYQLKEGETYESARYTWWHRIQYFFEDIWDIVSLRDYRVRKMYINANMGIKKKFLFF